MLVGHNWAIPTASEEVERDRVEVPPPHATEQLPQAPQLPMTQSVHATDEHGVIMASDGQAKPPADAGSSRSRVRCELPNAHS